MKLNPTSVRGYVLLAIDLVRLAWMIVMVVHLINNYLLLVGGHRHRELQQPLPAA